MVIKLGINGFGRIGRVIFRTCFGRPNFEVLAINDPAIDIEYICYLIKFDSTHGKFPGTVIFSKNEINIDGKKIQVFHEKLPIYIPWFSVNVQYVVEASGMFTNFEKASGHLKSVGVKRVIVTAPSADIPMLIVGVNEEMIGIEQKVISCASSTLYCLAPIVKILEDKFGVSEGFITSIHAMTPSLKPLDGLCLRGKHWRDHRSIHQNIIPAATGACKALNKIIPHVKDKLSGLAFRVPIVNVSVLDISIRLNMETSLEDIIKCVQKHGDTNMKNIITISNEESVSSDYLGEEHSCVLDANSSLQLTPNFYKLVCWYENEHSYACRVIDIINFSERQYVATSLSGLCHTQSTSSKGTITESTKSMFVPRNYRFEVYPNMVCSASQDTGFRMKLPLRSQKNTLTLRNTPINETTLGRVIKKTNEIFKVWNDYEVSKNPLRQNTSSFFQSCMALPSGQVERNKYVKNREHLQRVKEEFSKMVNMTEDLLKKTSHSGNKIDETVESIPEKATIEKPDKEEINLSNKMNEKESEKLTKTLENSPMGGDFKKHHNDTETDSYPKNIVHILKPVKAGDYFEKPSIVDSNPPPDVDSNLTEQDNHEVPLISNIEKDIEPIKNLVHEKEQSSISPPTNGKYLTQLNDTTLNTVKLLNNKSNELTESNKNNDENSSLLELNNTFTKEKLCGFDDARGTSFYDNNNSDTQNNRKIYNQSKAYFTDSNLQTKQKTLQNVLRKYTMSKADVLSEKPSRCDEDSLRITNKKDIYDKLDSASATDSENSFTERKSQIINITDLTNSIEDLARLDKICRIIEISDELSDKLFSALNSPDSANLKNKTWSFKDLCERLNLDEFCNKIFGQ